MTRYHQEQSDNPRSNPTNEAIDASLLKNLEWRSIGPYRGGRVVAVAGDQHHPQTFYFGSTGGGVWKTVNGGMMWENVSDGYFQRASVGALEVAPSDPHVIYAGMGEATIRSNVSHGDGIYRSTDGGQSWSHLGLAETRHIAKVRVHPHDPDLVYVAALGHAHGPNAERGVYRSRDGGKTWKQILFRSEKAGAIDLTIDPNNPRILYAAFWETLRHPHTLISGGEDSSLYKSSDGGDTWVELTRKPGLPTGLLGKIGVVVSPAREGRVWAIIEAEDGALFRSDDGGESWQRLSEERSLRYRAWYYQHLIADPQDPETLWALNVQAWKSIDGGKTFFDIPTPHADNHDLWIDPRNPQRMLLGNDGGACVSFNGGADWSIQDNQPTVEFYHVTTDTQVPYRIYGAQQDNTTICLPGRSALAGITQADCYDVGGGESGYIAVRPDDPNIVYAGSYQGLLTRYDHRSRQMHNITVWPETALGWGAKDTKYRFQWTSPLMLSPHDPQVLYAAGNYLFRSQDEGQSWQIISPDLTRNDPTRMEASGGPITGDNTGAEYYCTIFALAESPIERGVLWAGSDDGLVHISRDGGQSWENVTPPDLPEWALISQIDASPHDAATAYVAATRYKLDDFAPYLYSTNDYGKTWKKITTGLAADDFTRVLREDPVRRGLLFAGTETGISVSFDDGEHWQSLRLNLPVVPIHDLVIKDSDIILATHGRAFWILDDITPLRQISEQVQNNSAHLFPPRPTIRFKTLGGFSQAPAGGGQYYRKTGVFTIVSRRSIKPDGTAVDTNLNAGQNPPDGVIVTYYLKQRPEGEITLRFLAEGEKEVRSFSSKPPSQETSKNGKANGNNKEPRPSQEVGINRFVWDMRYAGPTKVDGFMGGENLLVGPLVAPGRYQVLLTVGEQSYGAWFEIQKDPRVSATQEDLEAQCALQLAIRDKLSETHQGIKTLRELRQQVEDWLRRTKEQEGHERLADAGNGLKEKLTAIEEELIQVKAKARQDVLNYPVKLNVKLATLTGVVANADAAPTQQVRDCFEDISARIDSHLQALQTLIESDVQAFNALIRELGLPALIPNTGT